MENNKAIILFDGVCNFCDSSVQFVLLRDKKAYFSFASLQSDFGQKKLKEHNLPTEEFNSFILIENGKLYQKSTAALRVSRKLKGAWKLLYSFIIVPPFIRNAVYDIISKNRYKWFGQKDECMIPKPEWRERFL